MGLTSQGGLTPRSTYLTSITPCDALSVNPERASNIKPSCVDRFSPKDYYILSPLQSERQKLPIAPINTSAILLTEAQTIKLSSRSLSHSRRKTNKQKALLLNRINADIKVPP